MILWTDVGVSEEGDSVAPQLGATHPLGLLTWLVSLEQATELWRRLAW